MAGEGKMKINWNGWESQQKARGSLIQAMCQNSFPQSCLITGPAGIGKKEFAMQLGQILLCEHPEHKPCGTCYGCRVLAKSFESWSWILPLELRADELQKKDKSDEAIQEVVQEIVAKPYDLQVLPAGKEISVHSVRAAVLQISGNRQEHKHIIMIPEADRMNASSANALLKTLEEVPPNCYFILTTSHKDRLLPTIRSRCLTVSLPPMQSNEVLQVLQQANLNADERLARFADGSAGRALYLAGEDFPQLRESAIAFLEMSWRKQFTKVLAWADKEPALANTESAKVFLEILYVIIKDIHAAQEVLPLRNQDILERLKKLAQCMPRPMSWSIAMEKVSQASVRIHHKCQPVIVVGALGLDLADPFVGSQYK
jgi:DNA polymerase III subunit delta'